MIRVDWSKVPGFKMLKYRISAFDAQLTQYEKGVEAGWKAAVEKIQQDYMDGVVDAHRKGKGAA